MNTRAAQSQMPSQEPRPAHGLTVEVGALFEEPRVSDETASRYLEHLIQNLTTTEKAIGLDFFRITLAFAAFLLLEMVRVLRTV